MSTIVKTVTKKNVSQVKKAWDKRNQEELETIYNNMNGPNNKKRLKAYITRRFNLL